jgi:hypothetical protein
MGTEIVPETSISTCIQLMRLCAREDFIEFTGCVALVCLYHRSASCLSWPTLTQSRDDVQVHKFLHNGGAKL